MPEGKDAETSCEMVTWCTLQTEGALAPSAIRNPPTPDPPCLCPNLHQEQMCAPHFALLFKTSLSSETKSFSSALACQKLIHIAVQPEQRKLTTDHISILNLTLRFILRKVQYQSIRHVIQKLGPVPSRPTFFSPSI